MSLNPDVDEGWVNGFVDMTDVDGEDVMNPNLAARKYKETVRIEIES
jgi:hypothetical protein